MTEFVHSTIKLDQVFLSPSYSSVIPLTDGRLMWIWGQGQREPKPLQANFSENEGASWSPPTPLLQENGMPVEGIFGIHLVRLQSGRIGMVQTSHTGQQTFHLSADEGNTWSAGVDINTPDAIVNTSHDVSIVLEDGRIVVPVYSTIGPTPLSPKPKRLQRFSESYFGANIACTLRYSYSYYSDDEGETWQRSRNETFVPLDNGALGSYAFEEPAIVALKDSRILMMGRTYLGQHFKAHSEDRGESWTEPEPTGLVLVPSPCVLKRIPTTGDLVIIWNQVSRWEYMVGLYRHRLTCAISKDEGETWQHHKNLESMDDTSYVEADAIEVGLDGGYRQPVDRKRYTGAPAPLRKNEPTLTFLNDKAIITYGMATWGDLDVIRLTYGIDDIDELNERFGMAPFDRANKVRVVSIDWFYESAQDGAGSP